MGRNGTMNSSLIDHPSNTLRKPHIFKIPNFHAKATKKVKNSKKHYKTYKPNNRTAEVAAIQGKPFYKKMADLKKARGLVGHASFGLSFLLGRHNKKGECGDKLWLDDGCVEAVACYTAVEDWGCCFEP